MKHRLILSLLLLLPAASALARKRPADETYVRSFPQTITVRTYLGEKASIFRLTDDATGRRIAYHPNNFLGLGAGITLRGIGINFSVGVPFRDQKIDEYGKTRRLDAQVHRYGRKLMLDVYLQRYRGFHLNEKDAVTTIPGPQTYPYFPNLTSLTFGASGLYVFNGERYSLSTMVNQQEWQLRSAGSFLLGGSAFTHFYTDPDGILPDHYKYPDFFQARQPKEIHYYGLTLNAGYGYTAVLDKASHYFIAGAVDVGAGPGYSSVYDLSGEHLDHVTYNITGNARIGAGYNSQKWFAGLYVILHGDYFPLPYDDSNLGTGQGIGRLVVARRISTRKKLLAQQPEAVQ